MKEYSVDFKNLSGKMRLTDPCYDLRSLYAKTVEVEPGEWIAIISKDFDGFVWRVEVFARSFWSENRRLPCKAVLAVGGFAVDSGQFGFFDLNYFPKKSKDSKEFDWLNKSGFYRKVCDANKVGHGRCVADDGTVFGIVTSSGEGDGCYDVRGWQVDGRYVGFDVSFIGGDEDDWNEDDCYGEEE